MQSGIKHNILLNILAFISTVFLISGCNLSATDRGSGCSPCGPHSIVFSADGTAYLLGISQLLAINPQGNITLNKKTVPNLLGRYSDMLDISNDGNIWEVTNDSANSLTNVTIYNLQGNLVRQITIDIPMVTSVKVTPSTDIGWVGGYTKSFNGVTTITDTKLEAVNISGQTLTSFTLPGNPTLYNGWIYNIVKLAISSADGTIWAWTPGYLSGYLFTGLIYGPYPVNLLESSNPFFIGCGTNEKWIVVNPVTNDIWMGNPATTTVLALSPNGTVQFQKNLDIYVSTMAVSPKTGNVWIGSNNKIDVLDPYGNVIKQLTLRYLNCITYIAISPLDDTVWVGSILNGNKNIFILDENGNIVNSINVPVICAQCG